MGLLLVERSVLIESPEPDKFAVLTRHVSKITTREPSPQRTGYRRNETGREERTGGIGEKEKESRSRDDQGAGLTPPFRVKTP